MKLFLLPKTSAIGKKNRTEWILGEDKVGLRYNDDTDKMEYKFIVRVELRDFGSEKDPAIWDRILWYFDLLIPTNERFLMFSCYTPEGHYIGDLGTAAQLYFKYGLSEVQPAQPGQSGHTCSIGFDAQSQKWVGWSHRAIGSFGIGHVVKDGNCEAFSGYTDKYLEEHPEENLAMPIGFECKTLDDAKRCAIAFADSVD
jgi:hypothetical protein